MLWYQWFFRSSVRSPCFAIGLNRNVKSLRSKSSALYYPPPQYELHGPAGDTCCKTTQLTHPRGGIFQHAAPLNSRSWRMEKQRKTMVIMCVGEPSALNARQGWALTVLLCILYKLGHRSPIKNSRKNNQPLSYRSTAQLLYLYINSLVHTTATISNIVWGKCIVSFY